MRVYRGAGILFYHINGCNQLEILLAKRRKGRQYWSIPGGEQDPGDMGDLTRTARRECKEEFGDPPQLIEQLHSICTGSRRIVFWFGLFVWRTYLVRLESRPVDEYPNRFARDYNHEFTESRWFNLSTDHRPERLHPLLYPTLLWLDWKSACKWLSRRHRNAHVSSGRS